MFVVSWPAESDADHAALTADNDLLLDSIYARAEPLARPFRDMLRAIPRGTKAWYTPRMSYWPTRPWDNRGGRVTLAGDAAHSMTFREPLRSVSPSLSA